MKYHKSIFIFIFLSLTVLTKAQTDSINFHSKDSLKNQKDESGKIFSNAEQMPSFPGGDAKLFKFLKKIKYTKQARRNRITGKIYVTFVINKEGKVNDAKILRGLGYGLDEEVLRVINKMPVWIPGRINDRRVSVQYNLPVNFNLH